MQRSCCARPVRTVFGFLGLGIQSIIVGNLIDCFSWISPKHGTAFDQLLLLLWALCRTAFFCSSHVLHRALRPGKSYAAGLHHYLGSHSRYFQVSSVAQSLFKRLARICIRTYLSNNDTPGVSAPNDSAPMQTDCLSVTSVHFPYR